MKFRTIALCVLIGMGLSWSCQVASSYKPNTALVPVTNVQAEKVANDSTGYSADFIAGGQWRVDEDHPMTYIVKKNLDTQKLIIRDFSGKTVYEKGVLEIEKVYIIWALRKDYPQLVVEYGEGGNDSFVQILDCEEGHVAELIDTQKRENSFGAEIEIRPQFRSGINPSTEPYEILLTDTGFPSSSPKVTRVFRFRNRKYRYFGSFDSKEVDDFRETRLVVK